MIDFMKMIVVSDFFINSIYMIFDIVPLIHTNLYDCRKCKRKDFPEDKMQDEFSSCRQNAGQDEKNRPATLSALDRRPA